MVLSAVIIVLSFLTLEVQKFTVMENDHAVTEGRFTDDVVGQESKNANSSVGRNENSTTTTKINESGYNKHGNEENPQRENTLWKNYTSEKIKKAFGHKLNNSKSSVRLDKENEVYNKTNSTNPSEGRNVNNSSTTEKSLSNDERNSSFPSFENDTDSLQDEGESPDVFEWRRREDAYNITRPEEYPYSVLVVLYWKEKRLGHCTGSIITESWVLTASHCLENTDRTLVYAGGNSLEEFEDYTNGRRPLVGTAQLLVAEDTFVHPLNSADKSDCDVGLIRVNKFVFTKYVRAVRLTSTPWADSFHSYTSCVMTGFGLVQMGERKRDDGRRKTNRLDVKSPCICSFMLQILFGRRTSHRYLCSRPRQDYGVCPGDSGGGLVCGDELRGVAMQMVRLDDTTICDISLLGSMKCGDENTLSVFEDVCPFLPWINEHVQLFNDSSPMSKGCKYTSSSLSPRSCKLFIIFNVLLVVVKLVLQTSSS